MAQARARTSGPPVTQPTNPPGSSPGVVYRPQQPPKVNWWQSIINSLSGETVYPRVGVPKGEVNYYGAVPDASATSAGRRTPSGRTQAPPTPDMPWYQGEATIGPRANRPKNVGQTAQTPAPAPTPTPTPTAAGRTVPGANRTNTQILRDLGWQVPDLSPREAADMSMFDKTGMKTLTSYNYNLDPDELAVLTNAYTGAQGYTPGGPTGGKQATVRSDVTRAAPLTWEAYNALNADQKRAVDFNTLLYQAREKDLNLKPGDMPEVDRGEYDKQVRDMFGERGASATFAPNTVNLLNKVGFSARGQDLDEFLSMDRAITSDEMKDFKIGTSGLTQWEWPEGKRRAHGEQSRLEPGSYDRIMVTGDENQYAQSRSMANQMIVDSIAIERAGKFMDEAMKNADVWDFNSAGMNALTGKLPTGMDVPWGFGSDADRMDANGNLLTEYKGKDEGFRAAYHTLTLPDQDLSTVMTEVNKHGLSDSDIQEMFNYFDMQTRRDIASGFVDPALRSPQDIRTMLGFGD